MKKFRAFWCITFMTLNFILGCWCDGDADSVMAPMKRKEQEALYSAIQGFVGNGWNGSDLYPDPCGWTPIQGVSCDIFNGLWYVTELSIGPIHDNSLNCAQNVEFRSQLFMLTHLKSLSFYSCFTSKDHPISIPTTNWEKLSSTLESLEFRSNPALTGQTPISFGRLGKLQSLVLIENGLRGEIPSTVGDLVSLRRLVLSGNEFTGRIPYSFGNLTQLLILDLSRNSLSGSLPICLGSLISLLKLDLSNNKLEGTIPNEVGNLKNLTLLDLGNNNLSGGLIVKFQNMGSLQELVLANNHIGGQLRNINWKNMHNLEILDLSNMGLSGEVPETISMMKRLRYLGLSNNSLTGSLPSKLANLPSITAMYVNLNNLTGELGFPGSFYTKLGKRFAAWGNHNLCYPHGQLSTRHAPSGVKICKSEVAFLDLNSNSELND